MVEYPLRPKSRYTSRMPATVRSYRIRAYPNAAQIRMLNSWFGTSRWLWNWALCARTKAYERRQESLTSVAISRRLTQIKKLQCFAWLAKVPATCLTQTLRDQDAAFARFFRRVKTGETPGYPRFHSRHDNTVSLRFQDVSESKWLKGVVSLPKLGILKLAENLPAVTCPDMVTLKREADGRYYVTFAAMVEIAMLPVTASVIGVDLGLTHLVTLSNGEKIENPRKLAARLKHLKQQQRCLARRLKGSQRREHQIICIEDLNVKGMIQHPKLARHMADASFGEFRRQLTYKCAWYGRTLVVVDRWFPSSKTCGTCSHKLDELRLDQREWTCPKCGAIHDRDVNAAQNLLVEGLHQLAPGEAGDPRVEAAVVNAADEARTGQLMSERLDHERVS